MSFLCQIFKFKNGLFKYMDVFYRPVWLFIYHLKVLLLYFNHDYLFIFENNFQFSFMRRLLFGFFLNRNIQTSSQTLIIRTSGMGNRFFGKTTGTVQTPIDSTVNCSSPRHFTDKQFSHVTDLSEKAWQSSVRKLSSVHANHIDSPSELEPGYPICSSSVIQHREPQTTNNFDGEQPRLSVTDTHPELTNADILNSPAEIHHFDYPADWKKVLNIPYKNQIIPCKVVDVYDGDTITVLIRTPIGATPNTSNTVDINSFFRLKIRVSGVDAPELKVNKKDMNPEQTRLAQLEEAAGLVVKNIVSKKLLGKQLNIKLTSLDKYGGRYVGTVYLGMAKYETLTEFLVLCGLGKPYSGNKKSGWSEDELNAIIAKKRRGT